VSSFVLDIETSGLSPTDSFISCIGLMNVESEDITQFTGEDEAAILNDFWEFSYLHNESSRIHFYGYNILKFDIPFIELRSLANGIKIERYDAIDVIYLLHPNNMKFQKRGDWCRALSIPETDFTTGLDMATAALKGDFASIRAHNRNDLKTELEILRRLESCNFLEVKP